MNTPFLEALPLEIRIQIYNYVLASPSGLVTLAPWNVGVARSLSLLRTCKQIHRECKAIIWQHNGLQPREPCQLFYELKELEKEQHPQSRQNPRLPRLELRLELLDYDELLWLSGGLKALTTWEPRRRFHSIKLATTWDRPRSVTEFKALVKLRKDGYSVDGRFYHTTRWGKVVEIDTAWPIFANWSKQNWLREVLLDSTDSGNLLKEIHDMFGGRLLVDGRLCYQNHKRVVDTIALNPRDGQIEIVPPAPAQASKGTGSHGKRFQGSTNSPHSKAVHTR